MASALSSPPAQDQFYQLGGTLKADAPCYVRRKADTDLLKHLHDHQFCYVLTSRQMGKSSLMVQTKTRLSEANTRVVVVDLSKIGQNVTPEQWYYGLLLPMGQELQLRSELRELWASGDETHRSMGPMQRWMFAIREVILPSVPGNIVVFIDEIDAVRGLPFSTDEFFAGIRQIYNERTIDPELERITFCLLGVAKPSDLIRNVNTTPFNIGQRIVLTYFTETEAEPLLAGLGRDEEIARKLLSRILWWTGGHPYLTQRLCANIAQDYSVTSNADVDRVCSDNFLSSRAREEDNNLIFVRDVVLKKEADRASLLDLYSHILAGEKIKDDDTSPLVDTLRLAGLVGVRENRLVVRNRIYSHVFDKQWIRNNMPDAELRRQKRAFYKGLTRAAGVAAVILLIVAVGVVLLQEKTKQLTLRNYASDMREVQEAFDAGNFGIGTSLLKQWMLQVVQPNGKFVLPAERAQGGFEWEWLWSRYSGQSATTYLNHWDEVRSVAISPKGSFVATGGQDSTVRIFDNRQKCVGTQTPSLKDGGCRAASDTPGCVTDRSTKPPPGTPVIPSPNPCYGLLSVLLVDSMGKYPKDLIDEDFAKPLTLTEPTFDKGKMVEGRSGVDQAVEKLFKDPKNNRADQLESNNSDPKHPRPNVLPGVMSVQFSPDGAWLAIATGSWRSGADLPTGGVGKVYLWSVSDPSRIFAAPTQHKLTIDAVTFNPHPAGPAKIEFATAGSDGDAEFFQIPPGGGTPQEERSGKRTYKRTASISAGKGMNAAAFSPNGRYYAMVFGDGHMAVKDMLAPDTAKIKIPLLDASGLMSVAFYDDNKILVGTRDGQILEVDRATLQPYKVADSGQGLVSSLTVSTDRKILISTGSNATVQVWRLQDHHQQVRQLQDHGHLEAWDGNLLLGHRLEAYSAAISPHNELIVSGSADKSVRFWDMQEKMDCRSEKTEDCYPVYASRPSTYLDAGAVAGVAFSPDGRQLAQIRGVAAKNGATGHATPVGFYDLETQQWTSLPEQNGVGTALAYSRDGKYVATAFADKDHSVALWNAKPADRAPAYVPYSLPIPHNSITGAFTTLAFSPDGVLAGSGSAKDATTTISKAGPIVLWRPAADGGLPYRVSEVIVPSSDKLNRGGITFSKDGKMFAACTDNTVEVWNTSDLYRSSTASPRVLDGSETPDGTGKLLNNCRSLAFSDDGDWLAAGTYSGEIAVWNTQRIWNQSKLWFTPAWRRLTGDGYWPIYQDNTTGIEKPGPVEAQILSPPAAGAAINAIKFSPSIPGARDGYRPVLAYATSDAKILLWDVMTQRPLPPIIVHTGGVLSIDFSPNGRCLASGSSDKTLRITPTADPDLKGSMDWIPYGSFWSSCVDASKPQ